MGKFACVTCFPLLTYLSQKRYGLDAFKNVARYLAARHSPSIPWIDVFAAGLERDNLVEEGSMGEIPDDDDKRYNYDLFTAYMLAHQYQERTAEYLRHYLPYGSQLPERHCGHNHGQLNYVSYRRSTYMYPIKR